MEGRCFLLLLFLVVPALTDDHIVCPDGFEAIGDTCYFFSNDKKEIDEAKWDCDYLGGTLATFDDCETLEEVTSSAEPCPYWINPQTSADCVEEYPPDYYYKYICQIPQETECELYCNGKCWKEGMLGCSGPAGRRAPSDSQCTCPEGEFCCVPPDEPSCAMDCDGECVEPDPDMDNEGCNGKWGDADLCPCPYGTRCCCKKEIPCEVNCGGVCRYTNVMFQCYGDFMWAPDGSNCSCPEENQECCVPKSAPSCGMNCSGECRYRDEGCDGDWRDPEQCPCEDGRECCCKEELTEPPTPTPTPCPMTDPPPSTDEHGCGLPVMATIPSDRAFDYEAMYEALMYYRSDPNAGEVKFDEVKEQFEKLSYQDGENLSGMTGDLTDTIKAMNDVWVLQYTDSETGYELAILLEDFDPATGMLPEDLDFSGVSYSYELKDKLYLLKQRYAALKLTIYIPDFIPDCEIITEIQLNAYFSLVKVPLVLVACVTIECEAVIIVPVVCYSQTWFWIGEPVCEWILITRIYVKLLFIQITYWVRYWWITAFPVWAVQPLPDCPDPDMGAIAPYEGYSSSFLNMAMDNFMSSVSGDMASELYVDQFRFVYNEELQGQSNTALSTMEGAVTDTVNGFKDKWVLTYQESPEDEESSILLEDFDPNASELPNEIQLGDLSGFPSYNERYLRQFQYRYMEMRQTVSLQTVIPTNCGTAIYSIRLNSRFTLRRLPFFLMACWEISFSEYLIIPVPCYEIYIICGIRVVIPVIKVMIIRREFWFGIWVFIPLPACPWPPAPNPGSVIAFGSPTGLSHLDTCTYRCLPGFQKCKGLNTLVCWKGQWRPQQFQLQCAPICPVAPAAGFGAVRVGCIKVPIFGLWLKEVCFYQCLNGWNRWKGSYVRGCRKGIWTGSPLVCLPPWITWPFRTPCDCKDVLDIDPASPSGIYMVYPRDRLGGFLVYCDMETDGGGWTVIQRREDGSVNFYLGWDDYKYGFPDDMTGEFWLGNDKINRLTTQKDYALRVDLQASDNTTAFALYNSFSVADEDDKYRLSIGGYSVTSTAGDAMTAQEVGHNLNNLQFSTYDSDNDIWDGNCAERFVGAWWYCACHDSNLNGDYDNDMYGKGVMWKQFKGLHESLPFSEMKIRPTG